MLPNSPKQKVSSLFLFITFFLFTFIQCTLDKRVDFSEQDKLGLESGSKPCSELTPYTRWFAFYGLVKLSKDPQFDPKPGVVYFSENKVNWWQGGLTLLTGFFSSIVFHRVHVSECDLGTRFVHRDDYEKFFEDEREKARQELFAKTEKELEEGLRKYLEKTSPAEHAGKDYSTIILRTGKILEARVVGQDIDSLKLEIDDSNGHKQESNLSKKEVYKVIFATKVIRVKDTSKDKDK
ncbi:hypothetical protein EHQ53_04910 [Leptospira langatensis]|uniref:Uncharacterized protein n=1 Tax=Leptospira langatensis TaxID=2484983 RepID=A0A5F1ZWJ3_9LEPT|nr:hypothetical protein [Leptospira langatensis]TGK00156.1 hypothetical protein EHO57_12770 [Leptospira langatensis]TGL42791.1 hypothetical protein EHQ53_04910 [Leptospira langatensis]